MGRMPTSPSTVAGSSDTNADKAEALRNKHEEPHQENKSASESTTTMGEASVLPPRGQKPPTKKAFLMRAAETPAQLRPLPSGLAAILEAEMALQENEALEKQEMVQQEENEKKQKQQQAKKKRTPKRKNSTASDKSSSKTKQPKPAPTTVTEVARGHPLPLSDPNLKSSIDEFGLLVVQRPEGWIGAYSPESRKARLERFREKRKNRVWTRSVEYDVRKSFAVSRLRVKGRFVKKEDELLMRELMSLT